MHFLWDMKRMFSILLAVLFLTSARAQTDDIPPYKKTPFYPNIKLLLEDSSTVYRKDDLPRKTPVMLFYFNPKCEHCQKLTEEIVARENDFKNIQIVMATSMHFDSLASFRARYLPGTHKNIVLAFDPAFSLMHFFRVSHLPFIALYNEWKELIGGYDGGIPTYQILTAFGK